MQREGPAPDLARFLSRLRELMNDRNMTQAELAETLGVGTGTVSEWFNRGRSPLSEVVLRMPAALTVNGHWLLTGEGPRTPPKAPPQPAEHLEHVVDRAREVREAADALLRELGLPGADPENGSRP